MSGDSGGQSTGPKLASIICRGIEQAKDVQLGELLFTCGIYGVEEEEAWLLAKRFSNLEALYGASIDSLMSYNLLNEAVAVNTYNFFRHPLNVSALNELQTEGGLKVRHG
ncbi:helix-hairpin-helix domain-containing protein [Escherichia coli]|uniref:helix-hairpin-helix domain-containing protein n=1 Tax=Escherichia coli TaxID=562 RepID=UPI0029C47801|nr:helix-hairpin-helix domain-containing protein [Escherichia coli]MDX5598144.1 helix-hairpin-helix domain-containing protein [Escherichia coli]